MDSSKYIMPFSLWKLQMGLDGEEAKEKYKEYKRRKIG